MLRHLVPDKDDLHGRIAPARLVDEPSHHVCQSFFALRFCCNSKPIANRDSQQYAVIPRIPPPLGRMGHDVSDIVERSDPGWIARSLCLCCCGVNQPVDAGYFGRSPARGSWPRDVAGQHVGGRPGSNPTGNDIDHSAENLSVCSHAFLYLQADNAKASSPSPLRQIPRQPSGSTPQHPCRPPSATRSCFEGNRGAAGCHVRLRLLIFGNPPATAYPGCGACISNEECFVG